MRSLILLTIVSLAGCVGGGNDPAPVAQFYEPCDFKAECVYQADLCKRIEYNPGGGARVGAICTVECTASDQCPKDGVCVGTGGDEVVDTCNKRCTTDDDCYLNYICGSMQSVDEGSVAICLPGCSISPTPDRC